MVLLKRDDRSAPVDIERLGNAKVVWVDSRRVGSGESRHAAAENDRGDPPRHI
jgi:hypothetical protein